MADADAALGRAREQNVRGCVVPGTKLGGAPQAITSPRSSDRLHRRAD